MPKLVAETRNTVATESNEMANARRNALSYGLNYSFSNAVHSTEVLREAVPRRSQLVRSTKCSAGQQRNASERTQNGWFLTRRRKKEPPAV